MLDQLLTYLKANSGDGVLAPWLAAVGLGTVIASFVAGWVALATSRRTVQTEVHKAQIGAQQKMYELLVAARLAVYGELSGLIAHLWKHPPPIGTEIPVLELLLTTLDAWDIKHGVLLGSETTNDFHEFRWLLHDVLEDLRAGKVNEANYAAVRKSVHRAGMQLELSLRSDIGVYGMGISQKENAPGHDQTDFLVGAPKVPPHSVRLTASMVSAAPIEAACKHEPAPCSSARRQGCRWSFASSACCSRYARTSSRGSGEYSSNSSSI
jgi:hypothetical protein